MSSCTHGREGPTLAAGSTFSVKGIEEYMSTGLQELNDGDWDSSVPYRA